MNSLPNDTERIESWKQKAVLYAWFHAELSEGQASKLLGVDRLEARRLLEEATAAHGWQLDPVEARMTRILTLLTKERDSIAEQRKHVESLIPSMVWEEREETYTKIIAMIERVRHE